jgi:imidazolonepropionase
VLLRDARVLTMGERGVIERGWVAVRGGRIAAVGAGEPRAGLARGGVVHRLRGRVVMPGFVDPHTHLLFAGRRYDEYLLRRAGVSYTEILRRGGGIHATVAATREASDDELLSSLRRRLRIAAAQGTTTIEVKSGYGLDPREEVRHLRLIARARREARIEVVPTFLAAHALPPGASPRTHMRQAAATVARVARARLADRVDVFVERGAFTLQDARVLARAAARHRMQFTIHADQFSDNGGAAFAARVRAVSADHLGRASGRGLRAMSRAGVVAVLLPGSALFVGYAPPDARRFRAAGVRMALATDQNPGTSPLEGMPSAIALGVNLCGMTPEEGLRAVTVNAAAALRREGVTGRLEVGMRADLVVLETDDERDLCYRLGATLVRRVYAAGRQIRATA